MRPGSVVAAVCLLATGVFANGITDILTRGTYKTGVFDEGAAEIGAFDADTNRLFVVNGDSGAIDVLDVSDPNALSLLFSIDISPYGSKANSVDVYNGVVAAAVEADPVQNNGQAVFFDVNGNFLAAVTAGALPDMITFTPNGQRVLVANEGEPNDDYDVDPEGTVTIIDVSGGAANITQANVAQAGFTQFNGKSLPSSIRIFGPGATVAQDLEPEYITVSPDSTIAYVACQENNALAIIDIASAEVLDLVGLGFKDHSLAGNGLDASDRDDAINIANWPVYGMYQPDSLVAFEVNGVPYLISANEGDARDYDGFSEEERIKDLDLDPTAFPNAGDLQEDEAIGRLNVTLVNGDPDQDNDYDALYVFGARSFSIWNTNGTLLFDSGDMVERKVAENQAADFNSNNDENDSFDSRSDNKGPEPEGLTVGRVAGVPYAFVGLERQGGFMVFDLSNPASPQYVDFINNRDFSGDAEKGTAGDLGPEGLEFISAGDSPTNQPLLAVMNEISGSATMYEIEDDCGEPALLDVAPIGQSGIQIGGTPDCVYIMTLTGGDGGIQEIPVVIGPDGTGFAGVPIVPDLSIRLFQVNANDPSVTGATVPTLQTWALFAFALLLAGAAIAMKRRQA